MGANRISRNNSLIESLSSVSNLDQSCSIPTLCTVDSVSSYGLAISKPNVSTSLANSTNSLLSTKRSSLKRARWTTSTGLSNFAKENESCHEFFSDSNSSLHESFTPTTPFSIDSSASSWGQFIDVNMVSECTCSLPSGRIKNVSESCVFCLSHERCHVPDKKRRMHRSPSMILNENLNKIDLSK